MPEVNLIAAGLPREGVPNEYAAARATTMNRIQVHNNADSMMRKFYPPRLWWEPERMLWAAVLQTAWDDARSNSRSGKKSALEWAEENSEEPGGFAFVCDALGLDGSAVYRAFKEAMPRRINHRGGRPKGYSAIVVIDQQRDKYDHDFITQKHCQGCANRYHKTWEARKRERDAA